MGKCRTYKKQNDTSSDDNQDRRLKRKLDYGTFKSYEGKQKSKYVSSSSDSAILKADFEKLKSRCHKYEEDIRSILLTFDAPTKRFLIGDERLTVTAIDVHLILGVGGGPISIKLKDTEYELPSWVNRCFGSEIQQSNIGYILYKSYVYAKLKSVIELNDDQRAGDVARLTNIYLLTSLLAPSQNSSIPWHIAVHFEDLSNVCKYDWCSYIADTLIHRIKTSRNIKIGGCGILLPFWLCEHTSLFAPVNDKAFPRFLKWDLSELNGRIENLNLFQLKPKYISKVFLKATSTKKKIVRAMLEFWESGDKQKEIPKKLMNDSDDTYVKSVPESDDDIDHTVLLGSWRAKDVNTDRPSSAKGTKTTSNIDENNVLEHQGFVQETPLTKAGLEDNRMYRCDADDLLSFSLKISQAGVHNVEGNADIMHVVEDLKKSDHVLSGTDDDEADLQGLTDEGKKTEDRSGVIRRITTRYIGFLR